MTKSLQELVIFFLTLGSAGAVTLDQSGCVQNHVPGYNYFESSSLAHSGIAKLFSVEYFPTFKVVKYADLLNTYKSSWPNASLSGTPIQPLVLWQCGTPKPKYGDTGVPSKASFISIPIQRAALPGLGVLHAFELLGATSNIFAMDLTYVTSPCAMLDALCDSSLNVDSSNATLWSQSSSTADVIFTDSFGSGASLTDRDVIFDMSADRGSISRAAWLGFVALFLNAETMASEILNQIATDYRIQSTEASRLASQSPSQPTVAWVSFNGCSDPVCLGAPNGEWRQKANGDWCQCGTTFVFSNTQFQLDIVHSAGGSSLPMPSMSVSGCINELASDSTNQYSCSGDATSHVQGLLATADVVIDMTYAPNNGQYTWTDFMHNYAQGALTRSWKFVQKEALYRIDGLVSRPDPKTGYTSLAWFETMPYEPQVLLSNLIDAIWNASSANGCKKYLRRLRPSGDEPQVVLSPANCSSHSSCGSLLSQPIQLSPTCSPQDQQAADALSKNDNLSLILGLVLGLGIPLLLAVASVISLLVWKRHQVSKSISTLIVVGKPVQDSSNVPGVLEGAPVDP